MSDSAVVTSDRVDDEVALVERMKSGDARAFSVLYGRYIRLVERVVRDNVHDSESVADVSQEVFTRALERVGSLRDPNRFRPWLLAIARHAAIDHRRRRLSTPPMTPEAPEITAHGPGPDEVAELAELARLVRGCVAGLSLRDATAVAMVTYLGFSTQEVATALGIEPNAAKVAVHRARARLRQALGLQLLARSRTSTCGELAALRRGGDALAAARHTDRCAVCTPAVEAEVLAYDQRTALPDLDASPATTATDPA